jgi:hypothetical protein
MDSVLITTAITTITCIKDALKAALEDKIERASREKLTNSLQQIGMIHDTLFHTRNELCRLQAENEQLRQELKTQKA